MGHIFRDKQEIPIPPEGHINHHDGQVSVYWRDSKNARRRFTIGKAASETTMRPNENFKLRFPELWIKYYGEPAWHPSQYHAGLYAAGLSIGTTTGIYGITQDAFGLEDGNAAMDFALFNVEDRSNSTQLFEESQKDRLCFSRWPHNDSWMSELFAHRMTPEKIHRLRSAWAAQCAKRGTEKVWLCIDGSNCDCLAADSTLAGHGHAKSCRHVPVVSFIVAVDARDGRPVTWFVNNGSMADAKTFGGIFQFLAGSSIGIEGVIIDRGFATTEILEMIAAQGIDYVVMLKSSSSGCREMLGRYAGEIRWNTRYGIGRHAVFGTTDRARVFAGSESESCIALVFDAANACERSIKLYDKVWDAAGLIRAQLPAPVGEVQIPPKMEKYFSLQTADGQVVAVEFNHEAWQLALDGKGYCAIASSRERTAAEIFRLYRLRDSVEKLFSMVKSQLGYDALRVHSDAAMEGKLAVCFIACILRTEIMLACRKHDWDTNCVIRQMSRITLNLGTNNQYHFSCNIQDKAKAVLGEFGVSPSHFVKLADEVNNDADNPIFSQKRELPSIEPVQKRRGGRPRKQVSEEENKPKRKPGRPKGSKNKATLEREAREAAMPPQPPAEKRRPGRPKGSRNKKTLEREAQAAADHEAAKRGRGRPKGSRNRKTIEREAREAAEKLASGKRGPGRPKGSKNKKTLEREAMEAANKSPSINNATTATPSKDSSEGSAGENIQGD